MYNHFTSAHTIRCAFLNCLASMQKTKMILLIPFMLITLCYQGASGLVSPKIGFFHREISEEYASASEYSERSLNDTCHAFCMFDHGRKGFANVEDLDYGDPYVIQGFCECTDEVSFKFCVGGNSTQEMATAHCEVEYQKDHTANKNDCERKQKVEMEKEYGEFLKNHPNLEDLKTLQDDDCKQFCKEKHATDEGVCLKFTDTKLDYCLCGTNEGQVKFYRDTERFAGDFCKEAGGRDGAKVCQDKCTQYGLDPSCGTQSKYWDVIRGKDPESCVCSNPKK